MVELKATDGAFFLGPVVAVMSWFFMKEIETTESAVILQAVQTNIVAMITCGIGAALLAVAIGTHSPSIGGGGFMSLEGTGLFSAILGFFFYGSAMKQESGGGVYRLFFSQPQFLIGLSIWVVGVFMITFGGVSARRKEEGIIFLNTWITLAIANYFIWEIFLRVFR
jgi:hypothetical protein